MTGMTSKSDLNQTNNHMEETEMKCFKSALAVLFILSVFVTGVYAEEQAPAAPAADAVTGSVSFSALNKYIFRGAEDSAEERSSAAFRHNQLQGSIT